MVNKSLPQFEVSAIAETKNGQFFAISPCATKIYFLYADGWMLIVKEYSIYYKLEMFSKISIGSKVHRGIFKIRVVED